MRKDRRLTRSHDALLGGVCAGFAERFSMDVAAVRIVVVVATLLSSGFVALGYAALWLILPDSSDGAAPVDVSPERVHSETYGTPIDPQAAAGPCEPGMPCSQQGTGHIPPRPPHAAVSSAASVRMPGFEGAPADRPRPSAPAASSASAPVPPVAPSPASSSSRPAPVQPASVRAMLLVGIILLSAGAAALFSTLVSELRFIELWPLSLLVGGILFMVVPTSLMARPRSFSFGLALFALGVVLLAVSTGLVAPMTLSMMMLRLWPVAFVVAGLVVLGRSLDEPWFAVAAGAVFAVVCVVGLSWYAVPGELQALTMALPGKTIILPNLWA